MIKHYHPKSKFIIIAILVIILAIGGFLLLRQHQVKKSALAQNTDKVTQNDPSPETKPKPEAMDPYINWKTFTSTRDGYELKYPPEWIVINETLNDGPYIRNMQFTGGGYPEGYINLRVLRDVGIVSGSNLTPDVWYANLGVTNVQKGPVSFSPDTVQSYAINGLDAKKAKSVFSEIDEDIFFLHNGALYEINMYPYGISENTEVKNILNSFKFI